MMDAYADFLERTLFNHILASIDDADGRTSYMVPVGRGVEQEQGDAGAQETRNHHFPARFHKPSC